jgi:site-specific recombinase XerC
MRLSSLFEDFCSYLRVEKEAAPRTVLTYKSRFADFIDFVQMKAGTPMTSHLTPDLCRAYQYSLDARKLAPNSVRVHLAMLSSFSEWLVLRDKLVKNPIDSIIRPRRKRRPPHGIPAW